MNTLVKICGLCRQRDVMAAMNAGADMLGFVLVRSSPRYVDIEMLAQLTHQVPRGILKIGVVVNADPQWIAEAVDAGGLDIVQFHGDETDDAIRSHTLTPCWKAVSLCDAHDVDRAVSCPADMILVDAAGPNARGGTGRRCNWELATQLAAQRPMVLAGGLKPDNVAQAVRTVRPYAVDVSSGVEHCPRVKDPKALRQFVQAARQAPLE